MTDLAIMTRAVFVLGMLLPVVCACGTAAPIATVSFGGDVDTIEVAGIDECDSEASAELSIDPDQPLVVIVHGCNASGGRFRALAQVFEAHDQQTVCFNYDDRESMDETSAELRRALVALEEHMVSQPITVLGHSQGGLVSRRALIDRPSAEQLGEPGLKYRLVTVSSPFDGIAASSHCSLIGMHIATLGVSALLCQLIAGDKWDEIHPDATFMRQPGELVGGVDEHLVIVTDERNTCRRHDEDGECVEDDFVFSVAEQRNEVIEQDERVEDVDVKAGHVEIVGSAGEAPTKLIDLLQEKGVLAPTPEDQREEIAALLRTLF